MHMPYGVRSPLFPPPIPGISHPLLAWAAGLLPHVFAMGPHPPLLAWAAGLPPRALLAWAAGLHPRAFAMGPHPCSREPSLPGGIRIPTIALYACQGEESAGHLNPA